MDEPLRVEDGDGRERGCRRHSTQGKRQPRGVLRYSDAEWAVIAQAAAQAGMRPGAWAQRVAHQVAVQGSGAGGVDAGLVATLAEELHQHRRVLANIGGNLNDLARAANSTGEAGNPLAVRTVLRLVQHVVVAADELLTRVRTELLS